MRERKILFSLAIATLVSTMLFAAFGVREARGYGPEPTIYLDTAALRTTVLFTKPITIPNRTTVPVTFTFYIRIARAPHETSEPPLATDKTFSWQVRLSWDPLYFKIADPTVDIAEKNFLQRHYYRWNDPDFIPGSLDEFWSDTGVTYDTKLFKTVDATAGNVLLSDALFTDPTLKALPAEYFDAASKDYAPDKGRHLGLNYDLPYTENLTQAVTQPDTTIVTDPNYNTLASVTITQFAIVPAGVIPSPFHLSDTLLWEYDGKTPYPHSTVDAYYIGVPPVPEFPLGFAPILMLAPLIPIVYLWRTRKKVMNK